MGGSPYLLTIGDIGVMADQIVTHSGTAPLAGSVWTVQDVTRTERKIPTWAIVCAVVGALLCLLGLLFLLAKEDRVVGHATVTVTSGGLQHATQIPVTSAKEREHVYALVAQARSMATAPPA